MLTITTDNPKLEQLLANALSQALGGQQSEPLGTPLQPQAGAPVSQPTLPQQGAPVAGSTPVQTQLPLDTGLSSQQPATPNGGAVPSAVPTAPLAVQTPVPTTSPSYSFDQLAVAGTQLVDAGKRTELVNLLQSFGANALNELAPDQYGNFATHLRSMGARI